MDGHILTKGEIIKKWWNYDDTYFQTLHHQRQYKSERFLKNLASKSPSHTHLTWCYKMQIIRKKKNYFKIFVLFTTLKHFRFELYQWVWGKEVIFYCLYTDVEERQLFMRLIHVEDTETRYLTPYQLPTSDISICI